MPVTAMLLEGVKLLVAGMGIVYGFLLLQVWVLSLTARLIRRVEGEPPAAAIVGGATGERYKSITAETAGILKGTYGATPAPVDEALQASVFSTSRPWASWPWGPSPSAWGLPRGS